mgnify:CR=1 FL=1
MTMTKRKATWLLAVSSVFVLLISAFSYFTDREQAKASISTADFSEIIKVTPDGTEEGSKNPGSSLENLWNANNPDKVIKPGDDVDLSYELSNIGKADIDVKQTFILTSTQSLTQADPEYRLFLDAAADQYGAMVGGKVVSSEVISDKQVKYEIAPFTLKKGDKKALNYIMVFNKYAANAFQKSKCTVDYLVEMRQHSELLGAEEGWQEIQTATITFGGVSNYKAVPKHNS